MIKDGQRVLIVEDNESLRGTLAATLQAGGYASFKARSVAEAREFLAVCAIDLVILDLSLPDQDGMGLLGQVRADGNLTPIVVLSARDDEATKVRALDLGADDYITKPFSAPELLARIRSALRHAIQARGPPVQVHAGDLVVDLARRVVAKSGVEVKLSRKEFDLLAALAVSAGKPVPHEQLLEAVWGSRDADIRYLRIYVGQVRDKIENDPRRPALLVAQPGYGYRLG